MSEPRSQAPETAAVGPVPPRSGAAPARPPVAAPTPPPPPAEPQPPVSLASPELADRAGAVMSRPEVLEARARAVAARETFSTELSTLKSTARATVDPRVRIPEMAQGFAEDPKRAVGVAAALGGGFLGLRFLRGRRAKPPTTLPPEVEEALAGAGVSGEAVRAALDRGFVRYLQQYGAAPRRRLRAPRGMGLVLMPIVGQLGREVVRQAFKRRDATMEGGGPGTDTPSGARERGPSS